MYFLIYGAGALGQALGCMLAANGHQVDMVLRKRFIEALSGGVLKVSGIFGDYAVPTSDLGLLESVPTTPTTYDYVLLTTKAYDTAAAVDTIATIPELSCPVVSLQNGCGNLEQLIERFGQKRSLGARVITGFEIPAPGKVKITVTADAVHVGGAVPGQLTEEASKLASAINQAGLPCIPVENIHQDLFAKLLYNCALNPLGAVLGVSYGLLGENTHTRQIMDKVIDETFDVIKAIGKRTPWANGQEYRKLFYEELIPATYNHRSSMLQDLESNKPTEVDALVGYVVTQGEIAGVATPTCKLLANIVRFKEAHGRTEDEVSFEHRAASEDL